MSSINLNELSIQELKKLVKKENEEVKKVEKEKEKAKLILACKKLQKKKENLIQEKKEIKQKSKPKQKSKIKPKFKPKTNLKSKQKSKQEIKTFDEYFQECIKNKTIPKDTPHYVKKALKRAIKEYEKGIVLEKSALANFAEKYVIEGKSGLFPKYYFGEKASQIKDFLRKYQNTKVRLILVCEMEKELNFEQNEKIQVLFERDNAYFQSKTKINLEGTNVKTFLKDMIKEILNNLTIYQKNGSGWYFKEVIRLEIHIVEYKPLSGETYIPLPENIMRKKAIINIHNKDDKCFIWSILRYLHPIQMNEVRLTDLKKYENDLKFNEIKFPVSLKDITNFEKQNPSIPRINVFSLDDNNKVYPLRINKKDCQKSIDLFLYSKDGKQHYSLIKNFSRLVRSQKTKDSRKMFICKKCFYHYTKEDLLEKHILYCSNNETAVVKMPTKKNSILKFKHHFKKLPLPFIIYADFECFTIPVNSCQPNPENSYTKTYQKHEPSGFCLYLKALDGIKNNIKPFLYTKENLDEDVSEKFIEYIVELTHTIYKDIIIKNQNLLF